MFLLYNPISTNGVLISTKKCALYLKNEILFLKTVSPSQKVLCFILSGKHRHTLFMFCPSQIKNLHYNRVITAIFLMHLVKGWHLPCRKENTINFLDFAIRRPGFFAALLYNISVLTLIIWKSKALFWFLLLL